jgi:hypothetical protein
MSEIKSINQDWFAQHFTNWFNADLANGGFVISDENRARCSKIDFSKPLSFKEILHVIEREYVYQCEKWLPAKRLLRVRQMFILDEACKYAIKSMQDRVAEVAAGRSSDFFASSLLNWMTELSEAHKAYIPYDKASADVKQMSRSFISSSRFMESLCRGEGQHTLRWTVLFDEYDKVNANWDDFFERIGHVKSLSKYMEENRKSFYFTPGKGSQETNYEEAVNFAKETIRIAKDKMKRFDD